MKTALFIDGSNFYHRLKKCCIQHSSCFDYAAFASFLLNPADDLCYVGYYVGLVQVKVGDSKSELLYAGQQRLFVNLRRFFPNIRIVLLSSDADLLPAVQLAQQRGAVVEYVGLHNNLSRALFKNSRHRRILFCSDLKLFERPPYAESS